MIIEVNENVFVQQSEIFLTLTPIILYKDTAFIADPSVTLSDLKEIKNLIHGKNVKNVIRFTTHCHWDHILSSPDLNIKWEYTSPQSRKIMDKKGPELISELTEEMKQFNEDYSVYKDFLLNETSLETEKNHDIEGIKFSAYYAEGHCEGQTFLYSPVERILLSADTLSPSELPTFDSYNNLLIYIEDLHYIEEFIRKSDAIIPGHGWPMERSYALGIMNKDMKYLLSVKGFTENTDNRKMDIKTFLKKGNSILSELNDERITGYSYSSSFHQDNLKAIYNSLK